MYSTQHGRFPIRFKCPINPRQILSDSVLNTTKMTFRPEVFEPHGSANLDAWLLLVCPIGLRRCAVDQDQPPQDNLWGVALEY